MLVQSRRRALVAAGLVSFGLVAPVAATATAAPAKPPTKAPQFVAEVMGPRAEPQPWAFGTSALNISNAGEVLVGSGGGEYGVADGRRVRSLASTETLSPYAITPDVMAPDGHVYGGGLQVVARWSRTAVEGRSVEGAESSHGSHWVSAANSRGDIAGCSSYLKVGYPFVGSFARGNLSQLSWPDDTHGNCAVTDMSERGVVTVNQHAPFYQHMDIFPRAATMTTGSVKFLKTPEGLGSTADAISPNGMLIVGRVYKDGAPVSTAWLSHRRAPITLKGAGAMTPKVVTNRAVVFGEKNGRVVMWQAGRTTDLTKVSRLPRGWVLTGVSDINARGQLSVTASIPARNETVAMRLTPLRGRG